MRLAVIFICLFALPLNSNNINYNDDKAINLKNESELHILTYNMWGLPLWLPKVGINMRFDKACKQLSIDQYDIICLQECFSRRLRKKVINNLGNQYYHRSDYSCNKKFLLGLRTDCYGGLMTLSKLPIIEEQFFSYPINENYSKVERIGNKGFLISTLERPNGDTINVINTHLYAGAGSHAEDRRMEQLMYMDSILNLGQYYSHDCLLNGDINIEHPDVCELKNISNSKCYEYIIDGMSFKDSSPQVDSTLYTIDNNRNAYCGNSNGPQKLDYIFYRSSDDWDIKNVETKYDQDQSYSDHLGLSVVFTD